MIALHRQLIRKQICKLLHRINKLNETIKSSTEIFEKLKKNYFAEIENSIFDKKTRRV